MPGRILVVDDVATNRIVMKVRLADACYQVIQADSGRAALHAARQDRPDLILLDVMMSDMDGIEVCRALKAAPETMEIPVIMVTSGASADSKIRALKAGADDFLTKPLDELLLLARVRSLLRASETAQELALREGTRRALGFDDPAASFVGQGRIALLAPRRKTAVAWKAALRTRLHADLPVMTRAEALALPCPERAPDVFLIAANLEGQSDGLSLLPDLRARSATRHASVVMLMPETARESAAMALDLGANDLIFDPFAVDELALRLEAQLVRKHQADRLRNSLQDGLEMAVRDPLTGLFNRRYALPHLARMAERAVEMRRPFAVMQLDLDRFKLVNDRHGHAAGDAVLEQVARILADNMRPVDLVARIGGEEFLVALPETTHDIAMQAAERLRRCVDETAVALPGGIGTLHVSCSIGVASCGNQPCTSQDLLRRADAALYAAKAEGRNKVTSGPAAA